MYTFLFCCDTLLTADELPRLEGLEDLRDLRLRQVAPLLELFRPYAAVAALLDNLVDEEILRGEPPKLHRFLLHDHPVDDGVAILVYLKLAAGEQGVDSLRAVIHGDVRDLLREVLVGNALGMQPALLKYGSLGHRAFSS